MTSLKASASSSPPLLLPPMNSGSILLFLLLFLSLAVELTVQAQCRPDQASALLQLKNGFSLKISLNPPWLPSTNCCSWGGVSCDASGLVVSLNLSSHGISGNINSSLFKLTSLQSLNLADNLFNRSSLPVPGFEKLGNLTHLNLSNSWFSGQVPSGISRLKKLVSLDLSTFFVNGGELKNPDLRALIGGLSNLQELYLDGVNLSNRRMDWCQAISQSVPGLQVLSLSGCSLSGPIHQSLSKLRNLSVIRLDQNDLSSPVPEFFGNFSSLTELKLTACELYGLFPPRVFLLQNLKALDLSLNRMLSGYLPKFPKESALERLILENTNFSGILPASLGNLKSLIKLDLTSCHFSGSIPSSIGNLSQLVHLDLSRNGFTGAIPLKMGGQRISNINLSHNRLNGTLPHSYGSLGNLTNLDLRNNSLYGSIPVTLFSLPALRQLQLNQNKFSGQLEEISDASVSLDTVDLSDNELQGEIPKSMFGFSNLNYLALASNNFSGKLELDLMRHLRNLSYLDLSSNMLSILNGYGDSSLLFPSITTLKLVSCNLTSIPPFLEHKRNMVSLDLSSNQISGAIPKWIWSIGKLSLNYLNLSHNFFTYVDGAPFNLSINTPTMILDLHSNSLGGPIPLPPPNTIILDYSNNLLISSIPSNFSSYLSFTLFFSLSNNSLTGKIPPSICNATYLQVLDLSYNNFSGSIPQCLMRGEGSDLLVLNLRGNLFRGHLPQNVGSQCNLQTLNLNGNKLEGLLPRSLANCNMLEVLDIGNNNMMDSFPYWLGNISTLKVLVLRSNKFHGHLTFPAGGNYTFPKLQIFDISKNSFNGSLPTECFENLTAMVIDSELSYPPIGVKYLQFSSNYYQDSVIVSIKGLELTFVKTLTILRSLDFSRNKFEGSLPASFGKLKMLFVLNMSHNTFTGPIPSVLGNLVQLESLDLSINQFSGEIPQSLVSLYFLSFLNLSYNKLEGRIPQGSQFSTFSSNSFEANIELCGSPLSRQCASSSTLSPTYLNSSMSYSEPNWQYIFVGVGLGGGLATVFGYLLMRKSWRRWYFNKVDRLFWVITSMFCICDNCGDAKIVAEESIDDVEEEEEPGRRFCVFCTQLDFHQGKMVIRHVECSCNLED